ncbi:MAG: hypothetical protein A2939_01400 [Parcubacteria group bacterium RIFCSPLOWO2_01_FULL_48_18]|nr:MAG: hypothetical protein A2939_01400 [Parcubacteria group bacterium RIFCSPLOWO2_01_FULL_48_18]OHB22137.1 MAG: hypothetical protein A3J67_04430 [Parcubacteria group bacterium RIFCSPHIGHO2_02_FULL_48_10b]
MARLSRSHKKYEGGFTVLEFLIVVAIAGLLAAIMILILDPVRLTAEVRNRQRETDVNAIVNLIYRNISDNHGAFSCAAGVIPTSTRNMSDNNPAVGDYDIAGCLVPKYISSLPFDPSASSAQYASTTNYDLQYSIQQSTTTGRITISAPNVEQGSTIEATR